MVVHIYISKEEWTFCIDDKNARVERKQQQQQI
jgi:hypothetical protein